MTTIFVEADEPLLVFSSIELAQTALEAEDVLNGTYPRAFDAVGNPFIIEASRGRVQIRPTGEAADLESLKALLQRYLAAIGEPAAPESDLSTLAWIVEAKDHAFWEEHDPFGDRFSKAFPLWGCALLLAALTGALYLLLR